MKNCPNCGTQLLDDERFCSECGAPLPQEAPAPVEEPAPAPAAPAAEKPAAAAKPKKKKNPLVIVLCILLAVVLAASGTIITLLVLDSPGEKAGGTSSAPGAEGESDDDKTEEPPLPVYGIYHKDGGIYYWDIDTDTSMLITNNLGDISGVDAMYSMAMTPDEEYILYPDAAFRGDNSVTLLIRDADDPSAEAFKVASRVDEYFVADDSETVIYLTEDKELCRYSISQRTTLELAGDVISFECSEDGKNVFYHVSGEHGHAQYRILDGKYDQPVRLPAMSNYECSGDLTVIVYEEERDETDAPSKTYMIDKSGETTFIGTEVWSTWITGDGSVYYVKSGKEQKLSKFVQDDTDDGSDLSVLDAYTISFYEFYKFDGESILIANGVSEVSCEDYEEAIFTYDIADVDGKVKLSELRENIYDLSEVAWYVQKQLVAGVGIVFGNKAAEIKHAGVRHYSFSEDYDRIFVVSDWDEEESCGTLYVADLRGSAAGELRKVAEKVSNASFADGKLFYVRDDDLYVEGVDNAIAKDALGASYLEATDTIIIGYNERDDSYTLGIYDGDVVEICEGVTNLRALDNGVVLYCDEDDQWFYYADGESKPAPGENIRQLQVGGWRWTSLYWYD